MVRFSRTVISANRLWSWGTKQIPRASNWSGRSPLTLFPFRRISPDRGRRMPHTTLRRVDFPAPFGPMMQ